MKKKNRIAIVLVIVLCSISFWFTVNNKKNTINKSLRDFAVSDTTAITKIVLSNKTDSLVLERKPSSKWKVNSKYNVELRAITRLLYTINKIEPSEPVAKNIQKEIDQQLIQEGLKCEVYQNNTLVKAYLVGKATPDQSGTYMALLNLKTMQLAERSFIVYIPGIDGNLSPNYAVDEKMWREKNVFDVAANEIKSVKVEVPFNPDYGYEVAVKTGGEYQLKLADGKIFKQIDTATIKQYFSYFKQLGFEKFEANYSKPEIDSIKATKPLNIVTVTTLSGNITKVNFYARKPMVAGLKDATGKTILFDQDRMNALINDHNELVVVKYYVFGKIMPPVDYFFKK
ncbi:MAG: DUF4340 domain-containing protein [Bacteroidia bacterium]